MACPPRLGESQQRWIRTRRDIQIRYNERRGFALRLLAFMEKECPGALAKLRRQIGAARPAERGTGRHV